MPCTALPQEPHHLQPSAPRYCHRLRGGRSACGPRRPVAIDPHPASGRGEGRNRIRRRHGRLGVRRRPCGQPLHQRETEGGERHAPTSTSFPTTASTTRCSFAKSQVTQMTTSIPRCSSVPVTRLPKTSSRSCRSSCRQPSWKRPSRMPPQRRPLPRPS